MKPLIVDTSLWIEWLRGNKNELREEARGRVLFLPVGVALELFSGAKSRKSYQIIQNIVESYERNRRLIVPSLTEYSLAGTTLADLGWPASKKSNDTLIVACARMIGAEIWTLDYSDFLPLTQAMQVSLRKFVS